VFEGQADFEVGAVAARALDGHDSAGGFDPVSEAHQAGAQGGIRSAGTVVADREPQDAVDGVDLNVDDRGIRMLGRVRQRLGQDVVRRDLDAFG
jgi:hypothetical protein